MLRYNGTQWISVALAAGVTISTIVGNGTIVTVTCATAHGLQTGNSVTISGCATVGYNVSATITRVSATVFTYVNATVGAAGVAPPGAVPVW